MKFPLFNFEVGPGVPLFNFEGGPGVPLVNSRGGPGPTFKLLGRGSPRSRVPGPRVSRSRVPLFHHANLCDLQMSAVKHSSVDSIKYEFGNKEKF